MIDRNKHWPVLHWPGHWAIGHWPRLEAVIEYVRDLLLLNSPASIVRQFLVSRVLGSMPSAGSTWPIFVSHLPDSQELDDAICVYDLGPTIHGELPDSQSVEHHNITLVVRSQIYTRGREKLTALIDTLNSLRDEVLELGVNRYELVNAVYEGTDQLGYDSQRRASFVGIYSMNIYRLVQA